MLPELMKYGAISGKLHAMYGKRLTSDDYLALARMKTIPDIAGFLKNHPGYKSCLEGASVSALDPAQLLSALKFQYYDEYLRIFKFISREDSLLMEYPVHKAELEYILTALRHISSPNTFPVTVNLPEFYLKHSRMDFQQLAACTDVRSVLNATVHTIYYPTLRELCGPDGNRHPDYTSTEMLLRSAYFNMLHQQVDKAYNGELRSFLHNSLGKELDMLNIIYMLRIKKFLPISGEQLHFYPYPISYKLRPELMRQFAAAPDYDSAMELVLSSPYKKEFSEKTMAGIEEYYYRMVYQYNKRQLSSGKPSVYLPIAYLNLKGIEILNLTNIIESVRYGVDILTSSVTLIGA